MSQRKLPEELENRMAGALGQPAYPASLNSLTAFQVLVKVFPGKFFKNFFGKMSVST